jgi:hypothetical protein
MLIKFYFTFWQYYYFPIDAYMADGQTLILGDAKPEYPDMTLGFLA